MGKIYDKDALLYVRHILKIAVFESAEAMAGRVEFGDQWFADFVHGLLVGSGESNRRPAAELAACSCVCVTKIPDRMFVESPPLRERGDDLAMRHQSFSPQAAPVVRVWNMPALPDL